MLSLVWLGIRIVRRALASLALHLLCVEYFWRCLRVIVRGGEVLAKQIVLIPHKFRLVGEISFRKDYSPPL